MLEIFHPLKHPLCRLPVWGYRAVAWFITSCAGVNAAIDKSSACKSSFKRSAFAFARCKKLCIWRHLLLLSAVIHESHSPIPPDWHHYTLLWITQPLLNRIIQNLLLKLSHINLCKLKIVIQIITAISW